MLEQDYIAKILDLEDAIVTKVESAKGVLRLFIEMPRREHICPCCDHPTEKIHDYREQIIKDTPLGRTTYLHLRKRRYVCQECGKRFYERIPFLPRYHRTTHRVVLSILDAFRKLQPATEIAAQYNISSSTAIRYFDLIEYRCKELPEVLSIDEFKGNAGGEKYQTILTDAKNKKPIDIRPNRFEEDLIRYFMKFPDRSNVKFFVTDMNSHFKTVAQKCFPNAVIIADRYHVVRQVVWAMENVRKNEQKKLSEKFRKYFKRSKSLLNKPLNKLTEEDKSKLSLMLEIAPRLAIAYRLKNYFMLVMRADPDDAPRLLSNWLLLAEHYQISEFDACIKAYHNWSAEILNSIRFPWSNGFTEGCNNKTKVLKRVCFGFRNFKHFRNRILHCATYSNSRRKSE